MKRLSLPQRSTHNHSEKKRGKRLLASFFRNFARIRRISLNKGCLGNCELSGLRIGDRSQFFILL